MTNEATTTSGPQYSLCITDYAGSTVTLWFHMLIEASKCYDLVKYAQVRELMLEDHTTQPPRMLARRQMNGTLFRETRTPNA